MAVFEKGHIKSGGRQKGQRNKTTILCRQLFCDIISSYVDSGLFKGDLDSLAPKERIDVIIKLLQFILPKPQAISYDISIEKSQTIEKTLAQLAEEFD